MSECRGIFIELITSDHELKAFHRELKMSNESEVQVSIGKVESIPHPIIKWDPKKFVGKSVQLQSGISPRNLAPMGYIYIYIYIYIYREREREREKERAMFRRCAPHSDCAAGRDGSPGAFGTYK